MEMHGFIRKVGTFISTNLWMNWIACTDSRLKKRETPTIRLLTKHTPEIMYSADLRKPLNFIAFITWHFDLWLVRYWLWGLAWWINSCECWIVVSLWLKPKWQLACFTVNIYLRSYTCVISFVLINILLHEIDQILFPFT